MLVRFDHDQLFDYRARRPTMIFAKDHWESYEAPVLAIHLLKDLDGQDFLMLSGPEPDVQWERFVGAVREVVERFAVPLVVGVHGIPMGVPHTRPLGLTAHGTRPELVQEHTSWFGTVQVPANGLPIALMADHQTTGGYPKIAEIAGADVPRLAQLAPGGSVEFARCTLEDALELRRALRQRLASTLRTLAWSYGK